MPITLTLPALVAGRDLADAFADQLGDVRGAEVVVDARELVSGTSSFAAQLLYRMLTTGGAVSMTVVGAPATFVRHLRESATKQSVSGALSVRDSLHLSAAS